MTPNSHESGRSRRRLLLRSCAALRRIGAGLTPHVLLVGAAGRLTPGEWLEPKWLRKLGPSDERTTIAPKRSRNVRGGCRDQTTWDVLAGWLSAAQAAGTKQRSCPPNVQQLLPRTCFGVISSRWPPCSVKSGQSQFGPSQGRFRPRFPSRPDLRQTWPNIGQMWPSMATAARKWLQECSREHCVSVCCRFAVSVRRREIQQTCAEYFVAPTSTQGGSLFLNMCCKCRDRGSCFLATQTM